MSLTGCRPGYNRLLSHNKTASGGGEWQRTTWRRCWTSGGECLFVCALFCISECLYVCVYRMKVKRGGGGTDLNQERGMGERYGLCPTAFGTKGPLLLCMLAVSVGDKVVSWEIRSGPANEKHAKGFAFKTPSFQLLVFILKHIILSVIFLHYQPPLPFVHLDEQTHCFIISDLSPAIVTFNIRMSGS